MNERTATTGGNHGHGVSLPAVEGWRPLEPHHPGCCELCSGYIEPRQKWIVYSPVSKTLRHGACHDNKMRSTDALEVWTATVYDDDLETTVTRNIVITTLRRIKAMPRDVRLVEKLATLPLDKPIREIRTEFKTKGHYIY